jgi:hypothetical protein
MRRIILSLISIIFFLSQISFSQTINIHKKDGSVLPINITDIDSITFLFVPDTIDLSKDLIAYYPFDGNANDESGNGNHAGIYGPILTDDRFGTPNSAFSFDGLDDLIDCGDIFNDIDMPFTITAWVYCLTNDQAGVIFATDFQSITTPEPDYYGFALNQAKYDYDNVLLDSTKLTVRYGDGGLPSQESRRSKHSESFLKLNQWIHVAGVVRGATDMSLFINGQDDGGAYSGTGDPLVHNEWPATIGGRFMGKLDEIRVYKRALSKGEIQTLYLNNGN